MRVVEGAFLRPVAPARDTVAVGRAG